MNNLLDNLLVGLAILVLIGVAVYSMWNHDQQELICRSKGGELVYWTCVSQDSIIR